VKMTRGKPSPVGPTVRLPEETTGKAGSARPTRFARRGSSRRTSCFPLAPEFGWDGKLDPKKFAEDVPEMKG
jgi:hypothetical protein